MSRKSEHPPTVIGWREWVHLPELGGVTVKAKVDTGARTSAIHAWNINTERVEGRDTVTFDLHPLQRNNRVIVSCRARLVDIRDIRDSGGHVHRRFVVHTIAQLGPEQWEVELSLSRRDQMGFRMLLGRAAVKGRFLVDPGRSYLCGRPKIAAP